MFLYTLIVLLLALASIIAGYVLFTGRPEPKDDSTGKHIDEDSAVRLRRFLSYCLFGLAATFLLAGAAAAIFSGELGFGISIIILAIGLSTVVIVGTDVLIKKI